MNWIDSFQEKNFKKHSISLAIRKMHIETALKLYLTLVDYLSPWKQTIGTDKALGKGKPLYSTSETIHSFSVETSMLVLQKTEDNIILWAKYITLSYNRKTE